MKDKVDVYRHMLLNCIKIKLNKAEDPRVGVEETFDYGYDQMRLFNKVLPTYLINDVEDMV